MELAAQRSTICATLWSTICAIDWSTICVNVWSAICAGLEKTYNFSLPASSATTCIVKMPLPDQKEMRNLVAAGMTVDYQQELDAIFEGRASGNDVRMLQGKSLLVPFAAQLLRESFLDGTSLLQLPVLTFSGCRQQDVSVMKLYAKLWLERWRNRIEVHNTVRKIHVGENAYISFQPSDVWESTCLCKSLVQPDPFTEFRQYLVTVVRSTVCRHCVQLDMLWDHLVALSELPHAGTCKKVEPTQTDRFRMHFIRCRAEVEVTNATPLPMEICIKSDLFPDTDPATDISLAAYERKSLKCCAKHERVPSLNVFIVKQQGHKPEKFSFAFL